MRSMATTVHSAVNSFRRYDQMQTTFYCAANPYTISTGSVNLHSMRCVLLFWIVATFSSDQTFCCCKLKWMSFFVFVQSHQVTSEYWNYSNKSTICCIKCNKLLIVDKHAKKVTTKLVQEIIAVFYGMQSNRWRKWVHVIYNY